MSTKTLHLARKVRKFIRERGYMVSEIYEGTRSTPPGHYIGVQYPDGGASYVEVFFTDTGVIVDSPDSSWDDHSKRLRIDLLELLGGSP